MKNPKKIADSVTYDNTNALLSFKMALVNGFSKSYPDNADYNRWKTQVLELGRILDKSSKSDTDKARIQKDLDILYDLVTLYLDQNDINHTYKTIYPISGLVGYTHTIKTYSNPDDINKADKAKWQYPSDGRVYYHILDTTDNSSLSLFDDASNGTINRLFTPENCANVKNFPSTTVDQSTGAKFTFLDGGFYTIYNALYKEIWPVELRSVELRSVELRSVELRSVELRSVELRSVELRSVELRSVELRSVELRSVELRSVELYSDDSPSPLYCRKETDADKLPLESGGDPPIVAENLVICYCPTDTCDLSNLQDGESGNPYLARVNGVYVRVKGWNGSNPTNSTLSKLVVTDPTKIGSVDTVDLSYNNFTSSDGLPDLYKILGLMVLTMNHNKLTELPNLTNPSLTSPSPTNLQILEFKNNQVTHIPSDYLSKFKLFSYLYCTNNLIESLPSFKGLPRLQTVRFSFNKLTEIPEDTFVENPVIEELFLDNNLIEKLPDNLFSNIATDKFVLVRVLLCNNKITHGKPALNNLVDRVGSNIGMTMGKLSICGNLDSFKGTCQNWSYSANWCLDESNTGGEKCLYDYMCPQWW